MQLRRSGGVCEKEGYVGSYEMVRRGKGDERGMEGYGVGGLQEGIGG